MAEAGSAKKAEIETIVTALNKHVKQAAAGRFNMHNHWVEYNQAKFSYDVKIRLHASGQSHLQQATVLNRAQLATLLASKSQLPMRSFLRAGRKSSENEIGFDTSHVEADLAHDRLVASFLFSPSKQGRRSTLTVRTIYVESTTPELEDCIAQGLPECDKIADAASRTKGLATALKLAAFARTGAAIAHASEKPTATGFITLPINTDPKQMLPEHINVKPSKTGATYLYAEKKRKKMTKTRIADPEAIEQITQSIAAGQTSVTLPESTLSKPKPTPDFGYLTRLKLCLYLVSHTHRQLLLNQQPAEKLEHAAEKSFQLYQNYSGGSSKAIGQTPAAITEITAEATAAIQLLAGTGSVRAKAAFAELSIISAAYGQPDPDMSQYTLQVVKAIATLHQEFSQAATGVKFTPNASILITNGSGETTAETTAGLH